ncbi:MAG: hypothetical protein AAF086_08015, partial [Planctomycetota bacterium]
MIRKPSPGSSGSSRPASPGASSSGSSSGTRAGTSAGTRAGTSAGTRAGFTTNVGVAEPAGGAIVSMPQRGKPKPMLVGLAIAGWATFAVEWIVVLVIILGRSGGANNIAVSHAQTADRPAISAPATTPPRTTATPTPPRTTTTTPPRVATPTPAPTPARPAVV